MKWIPLKGKEKAEQTFRKWIPILAGPPILSKTRTHTSPEPQGKLDNCMRTKIRKPGFQSQKKPWRTHKKRIPETHMAATLCPLPHNSSSRRCRVADATRSSSSVSASGQSRLAPSRRRYAESKYATACDSHPCGQKRSVALRGRFGKSARPPCRAQVDKTRNHSSRSPAFDRCHPNCSAVLGT